MLVIVRDNRRISSGKLEGGFDACPRGKSMVHHVIDLTMPAGTRPSTAISRVLHPLHFIFRGFYLLSSSLLTTFGLVLTSLACMSHG